MNEQLLEYARRELELVNEDPAVVDEYLTAIAVFSSLEIATDNTTEAIRNILCLLQYKPLSPLTDDPNEWKKVEGNSKSLWQSTRDAAAFSKDGGKTYTLISEVQDSKKAPRHTTVKIDRGRWGTRR